MKMSDQASRSVELTFSGAPNGQNVSAGLKVQNRPRSNNKNFSENSLDEIEHAL
jgi:hypothetical protein